MIIVGYNAPMTDDNDFSKWINKSEGYYELNCGDKLIVHVLQRDEDEWIIQSSHGEPKGVHPTKETAFKYAAKFAISMMENTLAQLANLEMQDTVSPALRWRENDDGFRLICGILVIRVDRSPDWFDENGGRKVSVIEMAKKAAIRVAKKTLREAILELG